jgi:hypothetical protein
MGKWHAIIRARGYKCASPNNEFVVASEADDLQDEAPGSLLPQWEQSGD